MRHFFIEIYRRLLRLSPLSATLLYTLVAAGWFVASSILLRSAIRTPATTLQLELASSMVFVLFTAGLLYLLLKQRYSKDADSQRMGPLRGLLPGLLALLVGLPLILFVVAQIEGPWLKQSAKHELRAIAELKSRQIEHWIDERYSDAQTLTDDRSLSRLVQRASKDDGTAQQTLRERLDAFRIAYRYRSVSILQQGGGVIFQSADGDADAMLWRQLPLEDALNNPDARLETGLRYHLSESGIHFILIQPFSAGSGERSPPALLILHLSPNQFLYPYITDWPTPSASGETLLAARQGDSVQFLTPLRHREGLPGTLTHNISATDLPAAIALNSDTAGTTQGRDYRGEEVIAAYRSIPATGWRLIVKRDRSEVMQPLYTLLGWVGVITLSAIVILGLVLVHLWRQQQQIHSLEVRAERRRADSLVRQFFDLPFIGIAITSAQSKRWLRYNQRLCEILGYPCEELAELSWAELTHPDDLAADEAQFDRVMRGEIDGYNMDKRYIRKDGSVVNAYIDVKCIRDAHGRVDQFVAMVQDISERKAAVERLRDSEARFRALFDTVTDGILVADLDNGHFVMGNSAIEAMLGYSHEQLTRLNFDDIHPAESLATVHKHINRQVNEAITLAVDLPVLRSDGSVFYADISSAPLTLQGKSYLVGVFRDITQKKQAQEALERARQQAQHYLDIAGTMIIALDLEGRLTLANRLTCELLGYTEEELLGQVWFECCIPPSQREGVKTVFQKLPSAKNDALEYFENPVQTRNGEERLIAWHNVLLRDSEGELYGILSSGEDVTEQRQAEARLIASEARLRTLVDTMPDLVWLKDVEGRYLACNPRFERFFGAPEAKIIGKTDYNFVDRELADFFREHDLRAMAAGSPSRNEETLTFADGSYTGTFETIKTPMLDRAGQVIGVLGIARDITQRKQQLAHIERLSRLYETLSHTNKAIVHSSNQDELFRKVCRSAVGSIGFQHAWIALLGDDAHTLKGQTAFTSHSDGSIQERDAGQLIATLQQQDIAESLLQHSPLWCDESDCGLTPWTDSSPASKESRGLTAILPLYRRNHLVGAFGLTAVEDYALGKDARELLQEMATDISFALDNFELQRQQRIAEEAMRQSANAITILDLGLNFIFSNHAFSELFGYDAEETHGASIALIAPPLDVATLQRDQIKEQVDRHSYYRGEVIRRHKNGELIPVYISAASLLDHDGELVGYVSSYNDMRAIKQSEERLRHALTDTIMAISHTIEKRDPYTAGHQQRVAELAVAIARQMGLDPERIEGIYLGSLIHDIGKIYIPSEILNRPGRLSQHEFGLIKSHPEVGYEIIKDVKFDWPIAKMVSQHHERIDGSGYPLGIKGDEICLEARIIAVADIVEAMTSHRPYRPGLGLAPALAEIEKQAGKSLDQEVVDTCLDLFQKQQFEWTSAYSHN